MAFAQINFAGIMGNLTGDPRVRQAGEKTVVNFQVALNERVKTAEGKYEDGDPTFVSCTCFGKVAENVNRMCQKGTRVAVVGRLKEDRWTDKEGQARSRICIIANEVSPVERLRPKDELVSAAVGGDEENWNLGA